MIFDDDALPNLEEISRELINGLSNELGNTDQRLNKPWTKAVNARLSKIGRRQGMLVCCRGCQEHGEWLLDVVWMLTDQHKIVLAVESEWGGLPAIEDDFDKLMSIKSPRKLMLFETNNNQGYKEILERLEINMKDYPYHIAGEDYMALEITAPAAFRYHFHVPSDGKLQEVHFEKIQEVPWPWNRQP